MAAGKKYAIGALTDMVTACLGAPWNGCTAHLFVADITPSVSDTAGTYSTSEASWTGYTAQSIFFGGATNDGTEAYADITPVSFTVTSGGTGTTVYGYYILESGGTLVCAERVVTPVSVTDGVPVVLDLRLGLENP